MTTALAPVLFWAAALHYAVLLVGFACFHWAHEPLYRLHRRWFDLTPAQFDVAWYAFFGLYKLAIWFFLLVPAAALYLVQR